MTSTNDFFDRTSDFEMRFDQLRETVTFKKLGGVAAWRRAGFGPRNRAECGPLGLSSFHPGSKREIFVLSLSKDAHQSSFWQSGHGSIQATVRRAHHEWVGSRWTGPLQMRRFVSKFL